jgi:vacuolar-type H+-ATPase catalytic subunit A/Vma1
MPPIPERSPEQIAALNEVTAQWTDAMNNMFCRLHEKAQREGWPAHLLESAIYHALGDDVFDEWEVWCA